MAALALLVSLHGARRTGVATSEAGRFEVVIGHLRDEVNELSRRVAQARIDAGRLGVDRLDVAPEGDARDAELERLTRRVARLEEAVAAGRRLVAPGEDAPFADVIHTASYYRGVVASDAPLRLRSEAFLRLAWMDDGAVFLADRSSFWIRDLLTSTHTGDRLRLCIAASQLPRSAAVESVLLDTFRFDADARVRENALRALGDYDTEAAREAVREGLRDPAARVREEARELLFSR